MVIANQTKSHFETLSAVLAGKAELRVVIDKALERRKLYGTRTILFVKQVIETLNWIRHQGLLGSVSGPLKVNTGVQMPLGAPNRRRIAEHRTVTMQQH
jgi:putative ATPase